MAKSRFDSDRINLIVQRLSGGEKVSSSDLAYLRRYADTDANFKGWLEQAFGNRITLSSGRVQDAKDAYNSYGFSPVPNSRNAGPGTQDMILRSGKRTNQTGAWQDAKIYTNGKSQTVGGRIRTAAETKNIIKRGLAGGSLSDEDQRIFDRWRTIQRETAENRAAEEARRQQEAAVAQRNAQERAKKFKLLGMKDDGSLNDLQVDDLIARRDARNKTNEEVYKSRAIESYKAELDAQKAEAALREKEIMKGRTADMTDEDFATWMNYGGTNGARWDYSERDKERIEQARNDIREAILRGEMNLEEGAEAQRQLDAEIAAGRWKKQVSRIPEEEMTAEQILSGRTVTMDDGTILGKKSDGTLYKVFEPNVDKTAEREERRQQQLQDRKDKWIDSRTDTLLKGVDEDGNPLYDYGQALEEAKKDAEIRFKEDRDYDKYPNLGGEAWQEKVCPICGAPLDASGYCSACGYTTDGAVESGHGGAVESGQIEAGQTEDGGFEGPMSGGMKNSYL